MKTMIQLDDLEALGWGSDELILFTRKEDRNNPLCLAIKVCFDRRTYYIDLLQRFLKFGVYEEVSLESSVQNHYMQKLKTTFPGNLQQELLSGFTEELDRWVNLNDKFKYEAE